MPLIADGMQTSSPLTYPSSVNFFNNQQEGYTSTFVPNYDGAFAFGPTEQARSESAHRA